jgi:quercetin dioxygenase-like cupin family protein
MPAMTITRLYTGSEGQSHAEQLSLDTHPELTSLMAAQGVQFRAVAAGHFMDWHPAPRRQFVIMLSGQMEIGLPDGSMHRFGPGDVLLAEDVTGKGHTRRVIGGEPRITATIPLAE